MEMRASQNPEELLKLLREVDKIQPKVIVEIGIHKGYSLEVWKNRYPNALIIGIENCLEFIDPEAVKGCSIIEKDSHTEDCYKELVIQLGDRKIDFLFIDGDHMYPGVRNDFEMYAPLVRFGGIVTLHDACLEGNPGVEVKKFWDEIKQTYQTKEIHEGSGTGTGVIYV